MSKIDMKKIDPKLVDELSEAQKEKIMNTQAVMEDALLRWARLRERTLEVLKHDDTIKGVSKVEKMFRIADKLTLLIIDDLFGTVHQLSPQVASVLSALILGITNGNGLEEVKSFLTFYDLQHKKREGDELH